MKTGFLPVEDISHNQTLSFSPTPLVPGAGKCAKAFSTIFLHPRYSFSMAAMPRERESHSCGLVVDPVLGPEIVVMGGYSFSSGYLDTVDIYTVNTDSWREGNMTQN